MTELKVKAAALAALVTTLVGASLLAGQVTDFVPVLPDWLEVPAYSLIEAGLVFLAAYRKKNVAGKLAPSTVAAAEAEVRRRIRG